MDVIYLDHNASTPLPEELVGEVESLLKTSIASPSSLHGLGRKGRRVINEANEAIASHLNCDAEDVYWTSGASEANSWVFHSVLQSSKAKQRPPRIIVSAIEHDSVMLAAEAIAQHGGEIVALRCTPSGEIDLQQFKNLLAQGPWDLISVMAANNETGVVQPVGKIARACRENNIPFHVDAVQMLGKMPFSVSRLGVTYSTFSGHKIGAPKGVGFVVVHGEGKLLTPMIRGKQQKGLRGGTENPFGAGIVARILARMDESVPTSDHATFRKQLAAWHGEFEHELKRRIPGTIIHGEAAQRLGNTTFAGFDGVDGDGILLNLDLAGICASSGSACTSGSLDPSHVLLAMGCGKAMARSSVRFSSGPGAQWRHFEKVLEVLPAIVERVRKANQ